MIFHNTLRIKSSAFVLDYDSFLGGRGRGEKRESRLNEVQGFTRVISLTKGLHFNKMVSLTMQRSTALACWTLFRLELH